MAQGRGRALEPIEERAYRFALRVVRLVRAMPDDKIGAVLGR